ncbi:hypothetical protein FD14_GL001708 [Secundilactobacillus similis DSM 23365 = JCM 2765]|uniref:Uncharacterized protein n=1 Tax=Secundilactobacillus similis DSM 23365 = JCM 2765 TaxID=1423804 RepID=A0A0R2ESC0_9LACO|nr:hypothetical protein FD14_GL001708 [Secundilactobacillus similis DSM 23365 = JCM 2765]
MQVSASWNTFRRGSQNTQLKSITKPTNQQNRSLKATPKTDGAVSALTQPQKYFVKVP